MNLISNLLNVLVLLPSHITALSCHRLLVCLSTPLQLDTNLLISSSIVLLSPLMIPWRKELTELSTEVPVVACDTKREMNNYADLADQWEFRSSRWHLKVWFWHKNKHHSHGDQKEIFAVCLSYTLHEKGWSRFRFEVTWFLLRCLRWSLLGRLN